MLVWADKHAPKNIHHVDGQDDTEKRDGRNQMMKGNGTMADPGSTIKEVKI